MSVADVVIVAIIAVLVVLCIRYNMRSESDGCADCGSVDGCAIHAEGGTCKVADDMIAHANAAFETKDEPTQTS